MGSFTEACGLWLWGTGSVAVGLDLAAFWPVGSQFPNQELNLHPFVARWILNHWTIRKVSLATFQIQLGENIYSWKFKFPCGQLNDAEYAGAWKR